MQKIGHFDLLYECVSSDMNVNVNMEFRNVWAEIGYILDKIGLGKYLDEMKELATRMSVFHIIARDFARDRDAKLEKAYKVYKDAYGFVTDTDEKAYSRNIKKCAESAKRKNKIFRPDEDAEKSVLWIKHKDGKNMYYLPKSKIQVEVMVKSDKPWARAVRNMFYKMADGTFGKTKNYTNKRAENDLKAVCEVYREIKKFDITYFEKCFEFYCLEYKLRIESIYKFLKTADRIGRKGKDFDLDMYWFKYFCIRNKPQDGYSVPTATVLANVYALDMNLFYELYSKSPNNLCHICAIYDILERGVINRENKKYEVVDIEKVIESEFAQDYFKDYCGEGQHIEFNKNFGPTGIQMSKFRKFYT